MFLQCFLIYFTNSYSQSNCVVLLHSILVSLIALQPICFNESENHPYRNKNRPKLIKSLQAHLKVRLFNFWLEMISDDGKTFLLQQSLNSLIYYYCIEKDILVKKLTLLPSSLLSPYDKPHTTNLNRISLVFVSSTPVMSFSNSSALILRWKSR